MVAARQWAQWALTTVLMVSALLLAVRTWTGPLTSPVHFRSPLNVESAIGLAATLLLLLRTKAGQNTSEPVRRSPSLLDAFAILTIAGMIAAVFWRSAGFYFLSDDFILLKQAKSFLYSFHGLFATPGGDGSYRPFTHLYMSVAYRWAGTEPADWHWIELALHAANSILVFVVARMLGFSRPSAAFAATLFAVHATRPEAAVWLAGCGDLLAAFFVLLGLASFIRFWSQHRGAAWFYCGLSLLSMTLAILSKESAYTFPLLLVVFLASKNALRTRRALYALIPFFAVPAALLVWRVILLGGIGGYRNPAGQPEVLSMGVITVVKALGPRLAAILFFPVNWSHDPNAVFGIVMILYLASLIWLTRAQVKWNAFIIPLGFLLVLALPPLPQLLIGFDLQKARLLYLPSVGFCLLLATAAAALKPKSGWVVAIVVLAFNIVAIFHNLSAWEQVSQKARAACSMGAACAAGRTNKIAVLGLPPSLDGVYFFANGFQECLELQRNGDAAAVDLRDATRPWDPTKYSCVLSWDGKTGKLLRVPYDIH
jgi:uncharacterized membrane protein